jgi:DNA segregation ATPase FtsK/SpoIIIE, S-DNA-T family
LPFVVSLWVLALAISFGRIWWSALILVGVLATLAGALYRDASSVPDWLPWFRLDRPVERWYASGCAGTAALWVLCATWGGAKPSPRFMAVLFLITIICAVPWWHHRRIRGSIPVHFVDLTRAQRHAYLTHARKLIQEWTAFTSAGHAQGARLRYIEFNPWSIAIGVHLRRGATVGEFTTRRLEKLESAFGDVQIGSARVERVTRHARRAIFRFMINDPHAEPISPPKNSGINVDDNPIGLFETGAPVFISLINTLIAGATGAGKSGVMNMIIRALARVPIVAMVGVDMKPGAPELGKWKDVLYALATNKQEASELLDKILEGLTYRGETMRAKGWRKWRATRSEPIICLLIDEVQEIKAAGLMKKLDRIAAMIRAYGVFVVVATQYPTTANISASIKMNCIQKIGLRVETALADRVIFGEDASRLGWRPSTIDASREGSFFIKSPKYKRPVLARAFWLDDDEVDRENEQWSKARTDVDPDTWEPVLTRAEPDSAAVVPVVDQKMIVDADLIEDDPFEVILAALERGRTRVAELEADTGMSRATLYRHLRKMAEDDLVSNPARGQWVSERPMVVSPSSQ